jgi:cell division protein FtsI/penicillin-binding protein 2
MAMIAGAIANDGKAAEPYIVKSIYNPNKDKTIYNAKDAEMTKFMSSKTANTVAKLWKTGVEEYYYDSYKNISEKISYAKTGTAQYDDNGSKYTNKLLMGTIEESKAAFYIVVENNSGLEPIQVANKLVDILPKN